MLAKRQRPTFREGIINLSGSLIRSATVKRLDRAHSSGASDINRLPFERGLVPDYRGPTLKNLIRPKKAKMR